MTASLRSAILVKRSSNQASNEDVEKLHQEKPILLFRYRIIQFLIFRNTTM